MIVPELFVFLINEKFVTSVFLVSFLEGEGFEDQSEQDNAEREDICWFSFVLEPRVLADSKDFRSHVASSGTFELTEFQNLFSFLARGCETEISQFSENFSLFLEDKYVF